MTGAIALQLGGSLIAILLLAGVAALLGLGRARIADADQARAEAEAAFPDFIAGEAIVDRDGRAAIVHGRDGSVVVLKLHGAHVAARHLPAWAVAATPQGWRAETGERAFGAVLVRR